MKEVKPKQTAEQPQVLYIGGCKVTFRYSGQKTHLQSRILGTH